MNSNRETNSVMVTFNRALLRLELKKNRGIVDLMNILNFAEKWKQK